MQLIKQNMNEQFARQVLNWKYEHPYDFYNSDSEDEEALKELLDGSYYALVTVENELFGFFCTGDSSQVPAGHQVGAYKEDLIDMGLGMNPQFVGQGKGTQFCMFIIQLIQERFEHKNIRLTVAKFNNRAIHLYEKLGFKKENEFQTDRAEFITMVRQAD